MSIIIWLQGLQGNTSPTDIRKFFQGLNIPKGGVQIINRERGAFITFASDEDGRLAMQKDGKKLMGGRVKLSLSSLKEFRHFTGLDDVKASLMGKPKRSCTTLRHLDRGRKSSVSVPLINKEPTAFLNRIASMPKELDIRDLMLNQGSRLDFDNFSHQFDPTNYGQSKRETQSTMNRNDTKLTEYNCKNLMKDRGFHQDTHLSKPAQKLKDNYGVELSGLNPNVTVKDVQILLKGVCIPENNIKWDINDRGYKRGIAYVCLRNREDFQTVLRMKSLIPKGHPISMNKCSNEKFYRHFGDSGKFLDIERIRKYKTHFCYMLKGLPRATTEKDIINFFNGLNLVDLLILYDKSNKATGTGYVMFSSWEDYNTAFERHGKKIGHCRIELFESTPGDIECAKSTAVAVSKPMKDILNEQMFRKRNFSLKQNVSLKRPLCAMLNGLSSSVSSSHVFKFFNECGVRLNAVHILLNEKNCPSGRVFVEFWNHLDFDEALTQNGKYIGNSVVLIRQVMFEEMLNILETNLAKHDFGIVKKSYGEGDDNSFSEKLPYFWDPPEDVRDDSLPPSRQTNVKKQPSHRIPVSSSMLGATSVISGKAFPRQLHDEKKFERDQFFWKHQPYSGTFERLGNTQNLNSDVNAVKTEFYEPCEQNNRSGMMHFENTMMNSFSGHADNSSLESYMPQESNYFVKKQCHKKQDEHCSSVPFTQPGFVKVEPIDSFECNSRNEHLFCKGQDVRKHPSSESRGYSLERPRQVDLPLNVSNCGVRARDSVTEKLSNIWGPMEVVRGDSLSSSRQANVKAESIHQFPVSSITKRMSDIFSAKIKNLKQEKLSLNDKNRKECDSNKLNLSKNDPNLDYVISEESMFPGEKFVSTKTNSSAGFRTEGFGSLAAKSSYVNSCFKPPRQQNTGESGPQKYRSSKRNSFNSISCPHKRKLSSWRSLNVCKRPRYSNCNFGSRKRSGKKLTQPSLPSNTTSCIIEANHVTLRIEMKQLHFRLSRKDVIRKYTSPGKPTGNVCITIESPKDSQKAIGF